MIRTADPGSRNLTWYDSVMPAWMRFASLVGFLALVCGILLAVGLTHYLQRYLSTPIIELASTLDRVSTSGDYSTRAEPTTGDEVGRLVNSFNTMLGVIHKKDIERNEAHRVTVADNLADLDRASVVRRGRGRVTVLDRAGLERRACECYAAVRDHLNRLLPAVDGRLA